MKRRRRTPFDLYLEERLLNEPGFAQAHEQELAKISAMQVRLRAARMVAEAKWTQGQPVREEARVLRDKMKAEIAALEEDFMERTK